MTFVLRTYGIDNGEDTTYSFTPDEFTRYQESLYETHSNDILIVVDEVDKDVVYLALKQD